MIAILQILKDGQFHAMEVLCAKLSADEPTIHERIKKITSELGLNVVYLMGHGYRISTPLSLLNIEEILKLYESMPWPVYLYTSIDSTNAEAFKLASEGRGSAFIVLAEHQKNGRGRRLRRWVSPFSENLYYSLFFRLDGDLHGLSLAVGLAVMRTLQSFGLERVGLKWPNDLRVNGKKISGVLIESKAGADKAREVAIGIGINVNMQNNDHIDQNWTSMRAELKHPIDRNALVARLTKQLAQTLERFRKHGFSDFISEWEQFHLWQGCKVTVYTGSDIVKGVALGVDRRGELRLEVNGEEQIYSSGEISLRLDDNT